MPSHILLQITCNHFTGADVKSQAESLSAGQVMVGAEKTDDLRNQTKTGI